VVVDALAAHLAEFPDGPDGLVFTLAGKPITRSVFGHKWRAAVKAAGLPAGTGFHALPHYYASLLIRHGESVKTVESRLGHASAVKTLDTAAICGPILTTGRGTRLIRCSDLLRTHCG
jgi:integrase